MSLFDDDKEPVHTRITFQNLPGLPTLFMMPGARSSDGSRRYTTNRISSYRPTIAAEEKKSECMRYGAILTPFQKFGVVASSLWFSACTQRPVNEFPSADKTKVRYPTSSSLS